MAIATEEWSRAPSRIAAKEGPIDNDEWLKNIGAITLRDDDTYAFTNQDVVRELDDWCAARDILTDVLTNAPWNLKERLRRRVAARWPFTVIWGPKVRNLALQPKSWRPSTVCALAAVLGVELIEGSRRMARWRGVVDERLS